MKEPDRTDYPPPSRSQKYQQHRSVSREPGGKDAGERKVGVAKKEGCQESIRYSK